MAIDDWSLIAQKLLLQDVALSIPEGVAAGADKFSAVISSAREIAEYLDDPNAGA